MRTKSHHFACLLCGLALALSLAFFTKTARANVYATDIKINGSLNSVVTNAAPTPANPVTITYHLNQAATRGCTVTIVNGSATVATIVAPTNFGLCSVKWGGTNNAGQAVGKGVAYGIQITAGAADVSGGTGNWTQISTDGTNDAVYWPQGIDVDRNTNSPYYGRVVVANATDGTILGMNQLDGLFKFNADSTPADEGVFGYANYTTNDNGNVGVAEMSDHGAFEHGAYCPLEVRIGSDDRIYFSDCSDEGAIIACDMQATTNQIVINEGPGGSSVPASGGYPACPNNYSLNPDGGYLNVDGIGWLQFDVAGFETESPALYLCDFGDSPSAGIWMYHLTNGAADPADNVGTSCVNPDNNYIAVTGSGIMIDTNLDLFFGQNRDNPSDPLNRVFCYSNWNGGVLPPEGDGAKFTYCVPSTSSDSAPSWAIGSGGYLCALGDTSINSRINPTLVAAVINPGEADFDESGEANGVSYDGLEGGIAILNAANGSAVVTNLDYTNWYASAAFDGVGNVYGVMDDILGGANNYWRVWSPPGANTNTTLAVPHIVLLQVQITSVAAVPSGGGCYNVTINFTAPGNLPASGFTLLGSTAVNGQFTPVTDATITQLSPGVYQATAQVCSSASYFMVSY